MSSINLSGVLIPCATPFHAGSGELDMAGFRRNLERFISDPVRGVVVGGSTGEAVFLEREERVALLRVAREALSGERLLVAGAGTESTRGTLRLIEDAASAGADAVLIQPPAFYRGAMTPEAIREHYERVADASPLPVILYQVPLRMSTIEFPTGLVAELSQHPSIIGIKDSRGDLTLLAGLVEACGRDFQVLVGSGSRFYGALEVGAVGGILGVANLVPGRCAAIERAFAQDQPAEAGRIQEEVAPLHDGIIAALGVAGVKAGLDHLGLAGGEPRSPLRPLPEEGRARVAAILDAAGTA